MTTGTDAPGGRQRLSDALAQHRSKAMLRAWLFGGLMGLLAITGIAGITWYAVTGGGGKDSAGPAPLIKAETAPVKVRPQKPGGMEVLNRDKQVYSRISGAEAPAKPARLQPPPEIPVARPEAPAKTGEEGTVASATPEPGRPNLEQLLPPPPPQPKPIATQSPPAPEPAPLSKTVAAPPPPAQAAKVEKAAPPPTQAAKAEKAAPPAGEKQDIAAAAKQVAAVAPKAGGHRIQLLASRSEAKTKLARKRIQKDHGKLLSGLAFTVDRADLGKRGVFYRLRAGPLPDRAAAKKLCARFKARKLECMIVNP